MITLLDGAIACVVALCIGVLVGGFNRGAHGTNNPESEQKSAAKQNAGPLWIFVPVQECDHKLVAPCIVRRAKDYARTFRN